MICTIILLNYSSGTRNHRSWPGHWSDTSWLYNLTRLLLASLTCSATCGDLLQVNVFSYTLDDTWNWNVFLSFIILKKPWKHAWSSMGEPFLFSLLALCFNSEENRKILDALASPQGNKCWSCLWHAELQGQRFICALYPLWVLGKGKTQSTL